MKRREMTPAQRYVAACRDLESGTMDRLRGSVDDAGLDRLARALHSAIDALVESVKAEATK